MSFVVKESRCHGPVRRRFAAAPRFVQPRRRARPGRRVARTGEPVRPGTARRAATCCAAKPAAPTLRPALSLAAVAPKSVALPGGNAQVQPKPEAAPRRIQASGEPISRGRFLKTIEHFAKTEEAKAIGAAVARVRAREVELAIQHAAKTRARYLACVVDLGANRTPLSRANVAELAELRKAHEELEQGIDALTQAIREGLVDVVGVEN